MNDRHQQTTTTLQDVKDIRRLMERSSRFTSLSGLSFIAAGACALIGAYFAYQTITDYYNPGYGNRDTWIYTDANFRWLRRTLVLIAGSVFASAVLSAFFFTWRKSTSQKTSLFDPASRRVFWNMAIPLASGGLFVFGMLVYDEWRFVAPGCLLFYGLALVNAGKYTLADIRYLGFCEILLALINMYFIRYGFYFWVIGFGVLHIVYGIIMWWKYDRVKS
jgi:hypothetical protein